MKNFTSSVKFIRNLCAFNLKQFFVFIASLCNVKMFSVSTEHTSKNKYTIFKTLQSQFVKSLNLYKDQYFIIDQLNNNKSTSHLFSNRIYKELFIEGK